MWSVFGPRVTLARVRPGVWTSDTRSAMAPCPKEGASHYRLTMSDQILIVNLQSGEIYLRSLLTPAVAPQLVVRSRALGPLGAGAGPAA
eukprot:COSAG01_NODE_1003_length_12216_cov_8.565350_3_plen_89_part_00